MKKFMIYAAAACLAGGSFVACTPEEDDIFDQSSAERLNATVPQYTDLLCSAENGWAMEYFVNNDWEPGYTYLMKFNKDTSVKMAGDNVWIGGKYTESTSVFEVITDNGPVLTFNTYNPIFHLFATPDDLSGNGAPADINESGYGHRGDYEFIIMKSTDDLITLKGKKWGLTILLRRMPAGVEWESYLEDLKEKKNGLFPSNALDMRMTAGGEAYVVTNMQTGVMSFYPEGGDALTETEKVPYIVTNEGIRFVSPFKGKDGKSSFAVQSFRIDEEKGEIVCTDAGQNCVIKNYKATDWLLNHKKSWVIDTQTLSGRFVDAYADLVKDFKNKKYGSLKEVGFTYTADGHHALKCVFGTKKDEVCFYDDFLVSGENEVKFSFTGHGDENGEIMLGVLSSVTDFCNLLSSGEYEVECPAPLNVASQRLVNKATSEDSFNLTLSN